MKSLKLQFIPFILIYFMETLSYEISQQTTIMDHRLIRSLFHTVRELEFQFIGKTGSRTKGDFLQEIQSEFPCDLKDMRSKTIPKSVQRLKPGDIDVIAALGDSLTAASGASSKSIADLFMENRGLSWSIGGQWNWRNVTTLPNILRAYNPNLVGYSRKDSYPYHEDTQFNMAEIGAVSADIPHMAKELVKRLRQDKRINFKESWKMVTICIGGNDICTFVCTMDDPDTLPKQHRDSLIKTFRYFRDHMPRTFINLVTVPLINNIVNMKNKPRRCQVLHNGECSCWIGHLYNQSKERQKQYHRLQLEMRAVEEEVVKLKEFRNLDGFAAVYQPWTNGLNFTVINKKFDYSLLAVDCFHMSQKGNAWAGVALWNNILEPPGNKSLNWISPKEKFVCPTHKHPYLYTNDNFDGTLEYSDENSIF